MIPTKFTLKNYRSFHDEQTIHFAQPEEHKQGSGLTYILGANNSGKTSLIEALAIKNGSYVKDSERKQRGDPELCLYSNKTLIRKCTLIRAESNTIVESPTWTDGRRFEIISSRRHWSSNAGSHYSNAGQGFHTLYDIVDRQNSLEVASQLRAIESDETDYREFLSLIQKVVPDFCKFAVGYEDSHFIVYVSKSGTRHKTDLLGDGIITIIRILVQLFVNNLDPLIIDEPELSLHPTAQKKLLNILAEYSQKRQIIISTHSPYMINWEFLNNGAVINRLVKIEDNFTEIFSITNINDYSGLIKSENWKMPFMMDVVAKEFFFMEDNILFLEGQEDVGLLKSTGLLGNQINFFGYGVRGKDNFRFALKLAKNLGYRYVACILDAGPQETILKRDLQKDFPYYEIIQWNKDDIRDKEPCVLQSKNGYFTSKGKLKPDSDLDDFRDNINKLNSYFQN